MYKNSFLYFFIKWKSHSELFFCRKDCFELAQFTILMLHWNFILLFWFIFNFIFSFFSNFEIFEFNFPFLNKNKAKQPQGDSWVNTSSIGKYLTDNTIWFNQYAYRLWSQDGLKLWLFYLPILHLFSAQSKFIRSKFIFEMKENRTWIMILTLMSEPKSCGFMYGNFKFLFAKNVI